MLPHETLRGFEEGIVAPDPLGTNSAAIEGDATEESKAADHVIQIKPLVRWLHQLGDELEHKLEVGPAGSTIGGECLEPLSHRSFEYVPPFVHES